MKKILLALGQSLMATVILLFSIEGLCFLAGVPQGASTFTESVVIREHLSTHKPADEFRIFVYGESTMHGAHYWPYSNPPIWLKAYLHDYLPGKSIRVINFARMGAGSHFVHNKVRDTMAYKADLAILYLGHNAFLPDNRKKQVLKKESGAHFFFREIVRQNRFLSLINRLVIRSRLEKEKAYEGEDSVEYKIIETSPGNFGPENSIPNNTPEYRENIEYSRSNVEKIINILTRRHVPAIFCKPVGNLKDFEPFMSVHMKDLSKDELAHWNDLYEKGKKAQAGGRADEAVDFFSRAYALDSTYADLDFRLGTLAFKKGDLEKAKHLFEEARDYDTIRVRASTDTLEYYQKFFAEGRIKYFFDSEKVFVSEAPGGILGEPIIEDNVHFSIKAHALLGKALAMEIANHGWIAPTSEWHFERERPFEEMLQGLGVKDELLFSAYLKMVHYFGSQYKNRIRYAQRALAMQPENPKALRHLAWSHWLKGDQDDALSIYAKLEMVDPAATNDVFQMRPEIKKAFEDNQTMQEIA